MRQAICGAMLGIALSTAGFCQPSIQLKNRQIDTTLGPAAQARNKAAARRAETQGRVHLILQYPDVPGENEANTLAGLGATVVGYVHENGLVVSIDASVPLDGLGLRWWGSLEAADKISPLLPPDSAADVLIETYPDVDIADLKTLAGGLGLELRDNPDVSPNQILGRASPGQIADLAEADIVAYIFPASDDLVSGTPSLACASALTTQGKAGQYIAKVGEGWDGPGLGSAALTYSWNVMTAQLDPAAAKTEVIRAFGEWTKAVKVTFTQGTQFEALKNINVLWGKRSHGDPYPFDGPGGVLAHTFYPSPPNPEPIAGDMHFDDDEHWRIGADIDLFSVALHETGHALGLGHSDRPGAVMYPYYQRATALTAEDIGAIQSLYAAQDASVTTPAPPPTPAPQPLTLGVTNPPATVSTDSFLITGTSSGGSGTVTIRWASSRGYSGTAQAAANWSFTAPLAIGTNTLTVTATDAQNASIAKSVTITRSAPSTPAQNPPAAITLQITYPGSATAYSTTSPTAMVRGIASYSSGIARVQWANNRGGSGTASGTTQWDTGSIALFDGLNTLTITAVGGDNSSASRTLQITYSKGNQSDTTPPSITITNPTGPLVTTRESSIVLKGTASDNVGVASVNWFSTAGPAGNATGTTNWTTAPIPLYVGYNTLVVRAYDAAGNMGWRTVQVLRTQ